MTDKMREAFINACKEYGPTISFSDFEMGWDACMEQAAKAVPVVGEPVAEAYVYEDVDGDDILGLRLLKEDYPMQHGEKLYIEPTTSTTEAELERLRKDAERWRKLRAMDWFDSPFCVVRDPKGRISPGSDCPSGARLDSFIDAIEDEKK